MWLFNQARDYYTSAPVAQQVSWEVGAALLFFVLAFIGFHLFRRAFGRPIYAKATAVPPEELKNFERYRLSGRLYHWGIFAIIAALLLSGATFYFPGGAFEIDNKIGISWLLVHIVLGWLFFAFVLIHIGYAIFDTGLSEMMYQRGDGRDLTQRLRYYLGGHGYLPTHGKFDAFQKLYHAFLILAALVMIVTGIILFLSAEVISTFDGNWLRWQRLLHDIFAFLFLAVICGHVYMRLVGTRRAKLKSMITGVISRSTFVRQHDWQRWKP